MNKRIEGLIDKATRVDVTTDRFGGTEYTPVFDTEKFAELIVKECFNKLTPYMDDQFINDIESELKEHFGVK